MSQRTGLRFGGVPPPPRLYWWVDRRPRSLYKKTPKRDMSRLSRLFKRRPPVDSHLLLFVHFVNVDEKTGSVREMPFDFTRCPGRECCTAPALRSVREALLLAPPESSFLLLLGPCLRVDRPVPSNTGGWFLRSPPPAPMPRAPPEGGDILPQGSTVRDLSGGVWSARKRLSGHLTCS